MNNFLSTHLRFGALAYSKLSNNLEPPDQASTASMPYSFRPPMAFSTRYFRRESRYFSTLAEGPVAVPSVSLPYGCVCLLYASRLLTSLPSECDLLV